MDLEEIRSNLEDNNTDEDHLKNLVNEIADDIEINPELSKDILNLFDKIINHPNFNRNVEIKAEKLLTNMLNMNPELSKNVLKIFDNGIHQPSTSLPIINQKILKIIKNNPSLY